MPQSANADCAAARDLCDQAKIYAYGTCMAALAVPFLEAACLAALGIAAGLCIYAEIACGGDGIAAVDFGTAFHTRWYL